MEQRKSGVLALAAVVLLGLGGRSAFHAAVNDQLNAEARAGNVPRMQALLRRGADVDGRSLQSKTPLMSAAEGGRGNAVLFLLAQQVGGTALQMAREYKQPVIAKMLQAAGARN